MPVIQSRIDSDDRLSRHSELHLQVLAGSEESQPIHFPVIQSHIASEVQRRRIP